MIKLCDLLEKEILEKINDRLKNDFRLSISLQMSAQIYCAVLIVYWVQLIEKVENHF
jgi:hypothetical protein